MLYFNLQGCINQKIFVILSLLCDVLLYFYCNLIAPLVYGFSLLQYLFDICDAKIKYKLIFPAQDQGTQ